MGSQNRSNRHCQQARSVRTVQTVHNQRLELLQFLILLPIGTDHILRYSQDVLGRLLGPEFVLQQRNVQDDVRPEHGDPEGPFDAVGQIELFDQADGKVTVAKLLVGFRWPECVQDLKFGGSLFTKIWSDGRKGQTSAGVCKHITTFAFCDQIMFQKSLTVFWSGVCARIS